MIERFEDYDLEVRLGAVGQWDLYAGHDPSKNPVMVMILSKEHCPRQEVQEKILTRLEALTELDVTGIVPYLDCGRNDRALYYVLRGLPIYPIEKLLERVERLRPLQVLDHGTFLFRTLEACHRQGVVHGQVDLRRIFVDDKWRVYLGLFVVPGDGAEGDNTEPATDVRGLIDALCRLAPDDVDDPATRALHETKQFAEHADHLCAGDIADRLQGAKDKILTSLEDRSSRMEAGSSEPTAAGKQGPGPQSRYSWMWGVGALILFLVIIVVVYENFRSLRPEELLSKARLLAGTEKIGDLYQAQNHLRELREEYPDSPQTEESIELWGRIKDKISAIRKKTNLEFFDYKLDNTELEEAAEILAQRHYEQAMSLLEQGQQGAAHDKLKSIVNMFGRTVYGQKAIEQLKKMGPL